MFNMKYREAIERNKLFRQFDRLVEFEQVTKAEIEQLKGLVLDVTDKVEPFLDGIHLTFRQYTKHDLTHLLNVANHIHDILPRQSCEQFTIALNGIELAYLWLAILLHDVGMFVSEEEEEHALLNSADYKMHCSHHRDRLEAAAAAENAGDSVKARAINGAVFAEFIRQTHAERVHRFINQHFKVSGAHGTKNRLRFRDKDLSIEIGILCESHNWGVRQSRDSRHPNQCVKKMNHRCLVGNTSVNICYLACCLRIGDILDFDRTRTPLSAFHSIHFTEPISAEEWNKHLSIDGISVNRDRVTYQIACDKPSDLIAVNQFLDCVDHELQETTRVVREFPQELADRYQLNVAPVVDRTKVTMANPKFVAGGFRFQLDYDQIMKLLMDKSLYPDETMFLRELLQNALDACRYQQARAEEKQKEGKPINYVPRIQVWDGSSLPHNSENPDDSARIEFRDNGIGMSLDQVESFFMRVGQSYYRSTSFRGERERLKELGIHLDACSRFGIGFLSCFLGGDRIVVETFQYGCRPLRITIQGPSKYFVIEQLPEIDLVNFPAYCSPADSKNDTPPNYSGTKVTIYLRKHWRPNSSEAGDDIVFEALDTYAVNQEIPLEICHPKRESRKIASRRWDRITPPLETFGYYSFDKERITDLLVPSVFDLSDHDEKLRGRGALWFLTDSTGNPVPQHGELRVLSNGIQNSSLISSIRHIIHENDPDKWVSLLENGLNSAEKQSETWKELLTKHYWLTQEGLEALTSGDMSWTIRAIQRSRPSDNSWDNNNHEAAKLWSGNLEDLVEFWANTGCGRPQTQITIQSSYDLALFGIESPGGFQSWDAKTGEAERHVFTGYSRPVSLAIDTYGSLAPEPAASRLFVPNERGDKVKGTVSMAILRHAKSLAMKHCTSTEWLTWFEEYISGWDESSGLSLPQLKKFAEELKAQRLPNLPGKAWYSFAEQHSIFAAFLVTPNFLSYRDLTQAIDRSHIEEAAERTKVPSNQIDETVRSLSQHLGWDITKGLEHPAP